MGVHINALTRRTQKRADLSQGRGNTGATIVYKILFFAFLFLPVTSLAQTPASGPVTLSNDKPVEVSSDSLSVVQDQHQAIFVGNVIAKQGDITMKADKMIVHYTSTDTAPAAAETTTPGSGISHIEAFGNVLFTNPTDAAKGDAAVYDAQKETLDLTGTVFLTRNKNMLKGTHMHYDLKTSRSVLTAGNVPVSVAGQPVKSNGRVQGVFYPDNKPKPAAK
jgi:lipopolysaccharide export system protein LptA